ncbi:MAG: MFS transporter [Casimicrobiaceae bacterium]
MDATLQARQPRAASGAAWRLLTARGLRAVGDGCISIVLPVHLTALGYSPVAIGAVATATLLGSGLATLLAGTYARRYAYRSVLLFAALLMVASGTAFAGFDAFLPLLVVAFVGTLNPSSGDTSLFLPLEHATLAQITPDRDRTAMFARYSLVGALCAAMGALLAGVPDVVGAAWQVPLLTATRGAFLAYALLGVACAFAYRGLPPALGAEARAMPVALGPSRRRVLRLAALFSLDSFAGGLIVQSLLALWLVQRFGLDAGDLALLFFATSVLAGFSYLAAVRIARRIGLLRTMVFTHLPSSMFLIAIAFLDDVRWVIVLLLLRSALSQMDVPTRTSYVMAVVTPGERPAAASITSVPRSLAAAVSPALAGYLLASSSLAWPLVIAGVLKIIYDLLLLASFRRVRPPEEVEP